MVNLTPLLTNPIGEEIWLATMIFVSISLSLWILSKLFHLKKQDYKTSLWIAIIIATSYFIIRSISLIFALNDVQKLPINVTSMVVEVFLLLILIKRNYKLKWSKSILIWVTVYLGKLIINSIISLFILFFFTTIF